MRHKTSIDSLFLEGFGSLDDASSKMIETIGHWGDRTDVANAASTLRSPQPLALPRKVAVQASIN